MQARPPSLHIPQAAPLPLRTPRFRLLEAPATPTRVLPSMNHRPDQPRQLTGLEVIKRLCAQHLKRALSWKAGPYHETPFWCGRFPCGPPCFQGSISHCSLTRGLIPWHTMCCSRCTPSEALTSLHHGGHFIDGIVHSCPLRRICDPAGDSWQHTASDLALTVEAVRCLVTTAHK